MLPNDFYERALATAWQTANHGVFGGALIVAPAFLLVDMDYRAADWNASTRLIRFSRAFIAGQPWLSVVEVLKHEMAHQYVSDVLGVEDETSHGKAFQMVCERYGIDGRASGGARSDHEEHAIDRIRKLLKLGSSPNEYEAQAAVSKARKLLDELGLAETDLGARERDDYGVAHLGEVVLRSKPEDFRMTVSSILAAHFRVRNIWIPTIDGEGSRGLQLEVCGRRSDLAIATHVHDFLHAEAERLWEGIGRGGKKDKLDFLEGIMLGFRQALAAQEANVANGDGQAPGLVRVTLKAHLDEYFSRRHPRTHNIRGSRRRRGAMYDEGVSAGRSISYRKPVEGNSGPKLLGRG